MNATGDPITDLLNRLRNAMRAGHDRADIPASRVKENLLKVLADEGYVVSYRRVEEKGRPQRSPAQAGHYRNKTPHDRGSHRWCPA